MLPWREPTLLQNYEELTNILKNSNKNKVLIVTDNNIEKFGLIHPLEDALNKASLSFVVYKNVSPNPTFENVYSGKSFYLENNCDAIVAVGGGSVMDCAKTIGILITNKGEIQKFKGLFKVHHEIPLLIALPTTSGTGSETTIAAVIRNEKNGSKFPIEDMRIVPKYALLDENLLLNLPGNVFSTTGMDALTHAVEAYLNWDTTRKTRKYSLEAIKLIKENLENGYINPKDLNAKKNMLYASFIAGKAFTRSMVGNVHAVAHAIGGKYNLPHGYLNSIILPYFLDIYKNKSLNKLSKISIYIGLGNKANTKEENATLFINLVNELNSKFYIPKTIKEIKEEDLDYLSNASYKEAVPLYPCPVLLNKKDFKKVYLKLMGK